MKSSVENKFISVVCFISTISQIPYIYSNNLLSNMVTFSWLLMAGFFLFKREFKIPKRNIYLLPIFFDLFCLTAELFTENSYLLSNLFKPVNMCTFIFIVGMLVSKDFDFKSLIVFSKTYILGTTITSIVVYFQYCFGKTIAGNSYLYNGKNSLSSIVLIALILAVILRKYIFDSTEKKIILSMLVFFDIYFLLILKSRTTLVCLALFFIWFMFSSEAKIRTKFMVSFVATAVIIYILNHAELYDLIVNTILLNGKQSTDFNAITSNRIDHVKIFLELFPGNEFIGIGGKYLESFPLTALLSYGILGSVWIFLFALAPILSGLRGLYYQHKDKIFTILMVIVSLSLILNGIAEEQPPFGPGIKCFAMWFLYGIYCGNSAYVNKMESE